MNFAPHGAARGAVVFLEIEMTDLYTSVTDRIVAALEAGTPPWIRPWSGADADPFPMNAASRRAYRGVNVLLLNLQAALGGFTNNRWMTYRQAQAAGAQVRKGEHGTPIIFFSPRPVEREAQIPDDTHAKVVPFMRTFTVFNVAQIDDLPEALAAPSMREPSWSAIDAAEHVLIRSEAEIHHGGCRAFYVPSSDRIQLPMRDAFASADDYYATALHELTHWTGHPSRCARDLKPRQQLDAYAFEELVAEMGAAFLCAHCGIPGRLEHASYIDHWLSALKSDKRLIFTAASKAQAASDYVLSLADPKAPHAVEMAA